MDQITEAIAAFNNVYWYVVMALLAVAGVWFTIRTVGVQVRMLPEMLRSVTAGSSTGPGDDGVSPFRAFTISAASRVGTGNVAGVAIAIVLGGPGAVFWMWLLALLGGATAFVESTLAQLYKQKGSEGFFGGPAYYIRDGLRSKWLAMVFAVAITFTYGFVFNAVQSNSISESVQANWGQSITTAWIVGVGLAVLTGLVIFGGVRRLSTVTNVVVPIMAVFYIILAIIVIIVNITEVPAMFLHIVRHAFGMEQVAGAAVGMAMILHGVRRGMFSNEAGMGSAPNAAATAAVSHPAKQGFVQSLGVYFDTLIVCTATAFIILLSNPTYGDKDALGMVVTQGALQQAVGQWAGPALTVIIFFLAWSSVLGNTYYGEANIRFLAGRHAGGAITVFRFLVLLCVIGGALAKVALVWDLADTFAAIMATINLIAILPLGHLAVKLLKDYERKLKAGQDPHFHISDLPEARGVALWGAEDGTDVAGRDQLRGAGGDPLSAGSHRA
ncbi:alanine/glycine:cation symporter family protein [Micrococcus sp. 2A]|uniref:alanine/glycine:cation symporter family protein n=1 Tax=Micrococcus TaxID=1269 RepID=UPI0020033034|nr:MULTISPECIES: alanine/glycine:cation symporter family protein [unclassified Micrococcus]MCK6095286.1 alanine:cation symporter family protein [Micrococcus sp. EYE_212]MCK6171442.1 alanine:cation symporter family protein [Micrococcus sp. EYE_162]